MPDDANMIGPPPPHIIETEVNGDISLYDAQSERVLILNSTASDVWRLCDGEQSLLEIVDLIGRAYGVDPADVTPEIKKTIDQFVEEGFLPAP